MAVSKTWSSTLSKCDWFSACTRTFSRAFWVCCLRCREFCKFFCNKWLFLSIVIVSASERVNVVDGSGHPILLRKSPPFTLCACVVWSIDLGLDACWAVTLPLSCIPSPGVLLQIPNCIINNYILLVAFPKTVAMLLNMASLRSLWRRELSSVQVAVRLSSPKI